MFDVVIGIWDLIWVLNIVGFAWVTYDVVKKQKLMPDSEKVMWILGVSVRLVRCPCLCHLN